MYTMSEVLPTHIYGVEIRVVVGRGGGGRGAGAGGMERGEWGGEGGSEGVSSFFLPHPLFSVSRLSPSLLTWGLFICSIFFFFFSPFLFATAVMSIIMSKFALLL